jgi:uncharacterized protein
MLSQRAPKAGYDAQEYWTACDRHELILQWCDECGQLNWFPRHFCRNCSSAKLSWHPAAGTGTIESFNIVRRAMNESYVDEVPYVLAVVRLAEGILCVTQIVGERRFQATFDAPVRVTFVDTVGHSLPCFELID